MHIYLLLIKCYCTKNSWYDINSYIAVLCSIYSFELSKNTMFIQRIRHIVTQNEFYSNNLHPIVVLRLTHSILYCVFDNPFNESKLYSINSRAFILDCFPIKLTVSIDTTLQIIIHYLILWTLSTSRSQLIILCYDTKLLLYLRYSCSGNFW